MPKPSRTFGERVKPLLLLIGLLPILSGCETTMASNADNQAACAVWLYISWSDDDTDQTIREAKRNNAARKVFCEGA